MNFFFGDGKMFDPVRHDDEFAFPHKGFAIAEFHAQGPFCDEKQFILVLMMMPDEFAFKLHRLHMEIIQPPMILGLQRSEKLLNLAARLIVSMTSPH